MDSCCCHKREDTLFQLAKTWCIRNTPLRHDHAFNPFFGPSRGSFFPLPSSTENAPLRTIMVGEEEISLWTQDAVHLSKEAFHGAIAMGRLNIDHSIKGVILKRKGLGISTKKAESFDTMIELAKSNRFVRNIDPNHRCRLQIAHDIGGSSSTSAPHFQDIQPF